jgi:hypothetical protein
MACAHHGVFSMALIQVRGLEAISLRQRKINLSAQGKSGIQLVISS